MDDIYDSSNSKLKQSMHTWKNQDMVFDVCARMDKENDKQKKKGEREVSTRIWGQYEYYIHKKMAKKKGGGEL